MATYNGNNIFLSLNGTDVSAYYTDELSFNESNATQETTAGAGQERVQRGKGLTDTTIDLKLVYDDATLNTYITLIKPGDVVDVIYGPETNVATKPKHEGKMIVASASHAISISRQLVTFTISLQQADAPTSEIHAGDVFAA